MGVIMKRTSLMVEEETLARLSSIAWRRGVTTAKVIREALGAYVAQHQTEAVGAMEPLIGLWADGPAEPLGERAEEIVAEAVLKRAAEEEAYGRDR